MAVAGRIDDESQLLHATLVDLLSAAQGEGHAFLFQHLQGMLEGGRAGQLPARGKIAALATLDDQHAKRTLVHLHIETTLWGVADRHAEHVFSITLPVAQIGDLSDEVTQSTDLDHVPAPELVVS